MYSPQVFAGRFLQPWPQALFLQKLRGKEFLKMSLAGQTNTTWLTRVQIDSHLSSFLYINPQLRPHSELWEQWVYLLSGHSPALQQLC